MDEIEQRLRSTADDCIRAYETWGKSKKNAESRERLQEAVHELRKVAARLEIELAASERDEMTQRHIPIPPHRASRRRPEDNVLPDFITEGGSGSPQDDSVGNSGNALVPENREERSSRPPLSRFQGGVRRPVRRPQDNQGNQGNE